MPRDVPEAAYLWLDKFRPGAPVMDFGGSLHVGADVAPPGGTLTSSGARNGVALSRGDVRDGLGAEELVDYLRLAASHNLREGYVTGLATFPESRVKVVKVVFTDRTRNRFTPNVARLTQDAVGIINTGLPFGQQIRFDPHFDLDALQAPGSAQGRTYGEILVWFIPKSDPRYPLNADPDELGRAQPFFNPKDLTAKRWEVDGDGTGYASVVIDSEAIASLTEEDITHALVHELLHAVGFVSHTDPARFESALNEEGFIPGTQPRSLIYPVDLEGLLVAYSRLRPGMSPEEISTESLGPWDDTSFHLRGDLEIGSGEVAFGVSFRNGLAQPWAFGPTPETTLRDNPVLSGSVKWNGALVGITPRGRGVVGDASLSLDMGDFLGELAFTGMRFEGGATWGDGDLHYTVRAEGPGKLSFANLTADSANTFRRADTEFVPVDLPDGEDGSAYAWTGKDLGTITGGFFGPRHEAVGGVLERHDLSAAFGGKR